MEPKEYIVEKIEGDYVILRDVNNGDEVFIAMALLPQGIDIGTRLHYELFDYSIV